MKNSDSGTTNSASARGNRRRHSNSITVTLTRKQFASILDDNEGGIRDATPHNGYGAKTLPELVSAWRRHRDLWILDEMAASKQSREYAEEGAKHFDGDADLIESLLSQAGRGA